MSGLENFNVIFRQEPKLSTGNHFGSRMVFDRDGYLFITLGENNNPPTAQDLDKLQGKVVRIFPDGRAPEAKGKTVEGTVAPSHVWEKSPAISGMAFYDSNRFKPWNHNLFIGALAAETLIRLQFESWPGNNDAHSGILLVFQYFTRLGVQVYIPFDAFSVEHFGLVDVATVGVFQFGTVQGCARVFDQRCFVQHFEVHYGASLVQANDFIGPDIRLCEARDTRQGEDGEHGIQGFHWIFLWVQLFG